MKADEILDKAHELFDEAERLNEQTRSDLAKIQKVIDEVSPPTNAAFWQG